MTSADRDRWEAKYAQADPPEGLAPDDWLTRHARELEAGRALELACGLGHNAIWLARRGWSVDAVDISPTGLSLAEWFAEDYGAQVRWIEADLDTFEPSGLYDLVVVFRFLDRSRLPGLIESALRPGGTLMYATFTTRELERDGSHLKNPAFALASGELPTLFPNLDVIAYDEVDDTDRCLARLVARRPGLGTD